MRRRTSAGDLAAPFVVLAVLGWLVTRLAYDAIPPLSYPLPVLLAVLALAEAVVGRRVRSAVRHVPGARPMTALVVARAVALGKASALVGAGLAGAAVGFGAQLAPRAATVHAAAADVEVAAAVVVGCVLLVVAGLALERAGVDPGRDPGRDSRWAGRRDPGDRPAGR